MKLFLTTILIFSCTFTKELIEREMFFGDFCGLVKIELLNENEYLLIHHIEHIGKLKSWGNYSKIASEIFFNETGHRLLNDTIKIGNSEMEIKIPENIDSTAGFNDFKNFSLEILNDSTSRTDDFYCGGVNHRQTNYYTYFKKQITYNKKSYEK